MVGVYHLYLGCKPGDHPADKDVMLRLMPADGGEPKELVRLFGDECTNNVPSWSPDGIRIAFCNP